METTRLSSKGQIILPKSVRDARQWKPGTEFAVEAVKEGVLLRPLKPFPRTKLEDVSGFLKYKGRPKTLEEMNEAIAKEVRARRARGRYKRPCAILHARPTPPGGPRYRFDKERRSVGFQDRAP